jgi:hypothetical protein
MLLFLGAGASKPFCMPDMRELTTIVSEELKAKHINSYFLDMIKDRVGDFGITPDIEAILTCIDALCDPNKGIRDAGPFAALISDQRSADKLTFGQKKENYHKLSIEIRNIIREHCFFPPKEKESELVKIYDNLINVLDIETLHPLYVYTTNYDLCFERYCEKKRYKLYDNFDDGGRLDLKTGKSGGWEINKLHGSSNWVITEDCEKGEIAKTEVFVKPGERTLKGEMVGEAMVYPTTEKYFSRDPYFNLLYKLRNDLTAGITDRWTKVITIIGYSFRDFAINNAFIDALNAPIFKGKNIFLVDPFAKAIISNNIPQLNKIIEPINKRFEDITISDFSKAQ